jgi:hypothetical protein
VIGGGVVRNSKGVLGADDRAGVYAILDLHPTQRAPAAHHLHQSRGVRRPRGQGPGTSNRLQRLRHRRRHQALRPA